MLAGYFKPKSHEIINIKYCPIQTETSDKIIDFIRNEAKNYQIKGYDEDKHFGELKHIVIRSSMLNQYLVTLVINSKVFGEKYKRFAKALMEKFDVIKGVCININPFKTNIILTEKTICLEGSEYIEEMILDKKFKIGTNTFFQVNPKSAENIFRYVRDYIKSNYQNPTLLDAYAGVGAFGIVMSDVARKVVSIEENKSSVELGKRILRENGIKNMEMHCEDAEKFFKKEKRQFTVTILDPPRKGCDEVCLKTMIAMAPKKIVYVSCDVATLARDARILVDAGYTIEKIRPVDQFAHTVHVETVVWLSKGMVDSRKVKVDFSLEDMDLSKFKGKATYEQIKAYVLEKTGLKVSSLYIAQIKKKCGLDVGENFNPAKSENARQPQCTPEKEDAIMQAFRHFGII